MRPTTVSALESVSYTHLDVYKRQVYNWIKFASCPLVSGQSGCVEMASMHAPCESDRKISACFIDFHMFPLDCSDGASARPQPLAAAPERTVARNQIMGGSSK